MSTDGVAIIGLHRAVRADAAACADRYGDGARRRQRLCLSLRWRPGAQDRRPHHHADRDRLQLRGHSAVSADGIASATTSGMSRELFRGANAFVGHLRGGLGIATIAACGGFAAICGSSVATAATFSRVAYPEMRRYGYPQSFATGVIAAGGTLGIMIPPSTVFAVYGLITEQDVGKLFVAGITPGYPRRVDVYCRRSRSLARSARGFCLPARVAPGRSASTASGRSGRPYSFSPS